MFHLPWEDHEGIGSRKTKWRTDSVEWEEFEKEIFKRLGEARPFVRAIPGATGDYSPADFRRVVFPITFDFRAFKGPLHAAFVGASFGQVHGFFGAVFGEVTSFHSAKFREGISFANAHFGEGVSFIGTTFKGGAMFESAFFMNEVHFSDATFSTSANFDDAKFGDQTSFSGAKFEGEATFSVRDVDKANPKFQRINFSNASFFGPCSFENRKFTANASFNDAEFHDLAKFHGCTFHQGMSFHGTKFLKTKGDSKDKDELNKQTGRLEQAYRTLKLGMETLRARNEEAYFFAKEMECRRQRSDVARFERFAATLYKHLSDYGQAVDLPLLWLLVLADVAFLAFGVVALVTKIPEPVPLLAFTFEQMLRPFGAWMKDSIGIKLNLFQQGDLLIPLLASVQSLGTLGFLTLFLLALRRRFKMD